MLTVTLFVVDESELGSFSALFLLGWDLFEHKEGDVRLSAVKILGLDSFSM